MFVGREKKKKKKSKGCLFAEKMKEKRGEEKKKTPKAKPRSTLGSTSGGCQILGP